MICEFKEAKDGNKTCLIDGIFVHSSYKPVIEAEKFVTTLSYSFIPKYIVITEPCLSYTAEFLKKAFTDCKLIAIRYCTCFKEYDYLWDKVLYYENNINIGNELFDYLTEEGISQSLFLSWKPSEKVFSEQTDKTWNEIKKAVLKSRQVLATRSYFAKRWFFNSIRNSLFIKNTCKIKKASKPVIICASGKSLNGCLDFIKENQNRFHIFCVSSALSPLLSYGIKPELCISTDGGYYAKKHITFCAEKNKDIVYAIPCEAAVDSRFLINRRILPLFYNDCPGDDFFKAVGLNGINALRNGTVSGTAAFLSLLLTDSEVYFCGLDLAENKGFAHSQPNELEMTDSIKDYYLKTKETRIIPQTLQNNTLQTYNDWFCNTDFGNRLYRLSNSYNYKNRLTFIKDVDLSFVNNKNYTANEENIFLEDNISLSIDDRKKIILNLLEQNLFSEKYINNILPAKSILIERCINEEEKNKLLDEINSSMNDLLTSVRKKYFNVFKEL